MATQENEIGRLLALIDAEYEAARCGMVDLAYGHTKHQWVIAHAKRIATLQAHLSDVVGDSSQATHLLLLHQSRSQTRKTRQP